MTDTTIFSDFLKELGVVHTPDYSNRRFHSMPFSSLYGFSKLLEEYNISNEAYRLDEKSAMTEIPTPFLVETPDGFVIVTSINPSSVSYLTQGVAEVISCDDFLKSATGVILVAHPDGNSIEPDFAKHHCELLFNKAKTWLLVAAVIFLTVYAFIANGLYLHPSMLLIGTLDIGGLYLTYLLMQKMLNIKNPAADKVCGVLQEGGCDKILSTKASKFLGLFSWSEVGFAYFSISLLTLMIFPGQIKYLALCNACCLPYTVWSIWYQKFRAHHWCTLCVGVQSTLWLLFFCYLGGGWWQGEWSPVINFFVLIAAYAAALLTLNRISPLIDKTEKDE